jgi:hypothetical protein
LSSSRRPGSSDAHKEATRSRSLTRGLYADRRTATRALTSREPCTNASAVRMLGWPADAIDAALGSAFDVASVDLPLTSEGGDVVELRPKGR